MGESKKIDKPCETCGIMMIEVDVNRKICTKCRNQKANEANRERARLRRAA